MESKKYSYEEIYDIFVELETIEKLIENNNQNQAINNIRHLKNGLRKALYPR